ncbi:MAG TPA: hypothetical protein HA362_07510 [Nanoarchaeota archaeon]|nr:hypothetical protein [Nanoarchaeota archaeon]
MQKNNIIALMAIIALLAVPAVFAANAYDLEDFSEQPLQGILIETGDIVRFNLLNATHSLRLKEISRSNTSVKINVYPYSGEGASMAQAIPAFKLDNVVKVDLDQDDEEDLLLDIYKIENGKVTLIFQSVADYAASQAPEILGKAPTNQGVVEKTLNYSSWYKGIGLAIILLVAVVLYRKAITSKKKKSAENKEE